MAEETKPVEVPKEETPATITEAVAATETPAQPEINTEETAAAPAGMCGLPFLLYSAVASRYCAVRNIYHVSHGPTANQIRRIYSHRGRHRDPCHRRHCHRGCEGGRAC